MLKASLKFLPGILFVLALAAVAYALGKFFPIVGGAVFGIVIGILVGNLIQNQFLGARDPTFGSAASLILMALTLVVTYFYTRKFGFGEEIVSA